MKKTIIISNRSVYFKYAEIEIAIPLNVLEGGVEDWLFENRNLWNDKLEKEIINAELEDGLGLDFHPSTRKGDMNDSKSESETRYDLYESHPLKITGGHL